MRKFLGEWVELVGVEGGRVAGIFWGRRVWSIRIIPFK